MVYFIAILLVTFLTGVMIREKIVFKTFLVLSIFLCAIFAYIWQANAQFPGIWILDFWYFLGGLCVAVLVGLCLGIYILERLAPPKA